jgi:hypothetical protein
MIEQRPKMYTHTCLSSTMRVYSYSHRGDGHSRSNLLSGEAAGIVQTSDWQSGVLIPDSSVSWEFIIQSKRLAPLGSLNDIGHCFSSHSQVTTISRRFGTFRIFGCVYSLPFLVWCSFSKSATLGLSKSYSFASSLRPIH